ncbi:MAG: hypothetical protein ACD_47C00183G0004 [uncultured bacterium]|uniref:Proteinase inhibitor I42 chagasin domain-containing protein n=1 Tax=Candidatus Wallbacteria bacterium GWC2_49_35 TaxID=1817813 RepID=A0A1F7WSM1_9BACT|nr:MAG: hypothetical protein ACD_47C00183G0004 [uncultured bacterium]OGM05085.1 MAG: hypothetical protein A2008_09255 [Candidatus Wallbacteria bacterium GWC2_49_35]HBC73980.1 hypothetical protein [Candidatus Wallbacteria bacterium]
MKLKSFRIFMLIPIAALFFSAAAAAFPEAAFAGANGVEEDYQLTSEEVSVDTNKISYTTADKITISVTNSSTGLLFIHKNDSIAIHEIERLEGDGTWAKLLVRDPDVRYDIGPPEEFRDGEKYIFDWTPCFYEKKEETRNSRAGYAKMPFAPGKYRLIMIFQRRPSDDVSTWKWLLTDSNEFEIVK